MFAILVFLLTLKMPRKHASKNVVFMLSAEYSCNFFKPIFTYREHLIWVNTVCKNDFYNHKQMTKQTTFVVIGSLRVN